MTTISVDDEIRTYLVNDNKVLVENQNKWYYAHPFWYKVNEFGTTSIYVLDDIRKLVSEGYTPGTVKRLINARFKQ